MTPNARLFQESITQEIDAVKNRVRNLIGSAHWAEEGRFKEAVLKNILRKFLPSNLSVGTGFIVKADGYGDADTILSSQLDVIIYDNTLPVLFSEGDFIITTTSNVRGIIEVKSDLDNTGLREAINKFDESIQGFKAELALHRRDVFMGIFSYSFTGNIQSDTVENAIKDSKHKVNHISLGTDFFIKKWKQENGANLGVRSSGDFYNYNIDNLSYSYFIANLIHIVSSKSGLNDRYWFSFPIRGTKEVNRIKTIHLPTRKKFSVTGKAKAAR